MIKSKQAVALETRVEAKAKGWKKFYWGKVQAYDADSNTYTVVFDDGDVKSEIKSFNIKVPEGSITYTAPDGKTFNNKSEYKKYIAETYYTWKNLSDNKTLVKKIGEVDGQSFTIDHLTNCEVMLLDHSDQVLIDYVENCKILIGPSSQSVFVRNAINCELYIACKQFRSRDCKNCTISLYSKTEPIVESSSNMKFYPYMAKFPNQSSLFPKANLIPDHNHWCNVFDFNKGDSKYPEPHWLLLPEEEGWKEWVVDVENGAGDANKTPENPVPKTARAVPTPKETGFAIGLSQDQAQAAFDAQNASAAAVTTAAAATTAAVEALPKGVVELNVNDAAATAAATATATATASVSAPATATTNAPLPPS